jgi:hypothetical protein
MNELKKRLIEKSEVRTPSELEFNPPMNIPELYNERRTVYYRENFDRYVYPPGTENVEEKKRAHFALGRRIFNAPNVILIYTDKAFLDIP